MKETTLSEHEFNITHKALVNAKRGLGFLYGLLKADDLDDAYYMIASNTSSEQEIEDTIELVDNVIKRLEFIKGR